MAYRGHRRAGICDGRVLLHNREESEKFPFLVGKVGNRVVGEYRRHCPILASCPALQQRAMDDRLDLVLTGYRSYEVERARLSYSYKKRI